MNVSVFTMNKAEAEKKLLAYRTQLKRRANKEYELAAKAYEMVAKGLAVLNVADAFAQTGLGEDLRPRLAIARADRKEVEVEVLPNRSRLIFNTLERSTSGYSGDLLINIPFSFTSEQVNAIGWGKSGFALVPMIPADVRPAEGQDKDYFILWEVERWANRSLTARPSRDPYLLKHIAGELYAVVAEWDLTDLELSIMAGIRNRRR